MRWFWNCVEESRKLRQILVHQVARTTLERAVSLPAERPEDPDPVQRIAEVLRATEKADATRGMLKTLQAQDPEMALRIQKLLYRFEDIIHLDDAAGTDRSWEKSKPQRSQQRCSEATPPFMNKVMSNLSKRARLTLEEELSFLSRVPESQLKEAQRIRWQTPSPKSKWRCAISHAPRTNSLFRQPPSDLPVASGNQPGAVRTRQVIPCMNRRRPMNNNCGSRMNPSAKHWSRFRTR